MARDTGSSAQIEAAEKATLKRVEDYLNNITTLEAEFLQIDSEGNTAKGKVYLMRPGHARFEYAAPHQILLLADGINMYFIDDEVDQVSALGLEETPIGFLLKETIEPGGALVVTGLERRPGVVEVELVKRDAPEVGAVRLVFSDAQGGRVRVALNDVDRNVKVDPELFKLNRELTTPHDESVP